MDSFNERVVFDRVKTLRRYLILRSWPRLIIPVISHVGSLVTIGFAYYARSGSPKFDTNNYIDWLVVVIATFVLISGINVVTKELRTPNEITINRQELNDLVCAAKLDAKSSIHSFGGDLSWAEDERNLLQYLAEKSEFLTTTIHYDRQKAPLTDFISKIDEKGIEFSPYPDGITPNFRALLVDHKDEGKACFYWKLADKKPGSPRNEHNFRYIEVDSSHRDWNLLELFLQTLDRLSCSTVVICISGVNNIGKTTIATRLRDILKQDYKVQFIGDHFKRLGCQVSHKENLRVMVEHLVYIHDKVDFCIIDRGIHDDMIFAQLRNQLPPPAYQSLAERVARVIQKYDILADVQRTDNDYDEDTTLVKGTDRKRARKLFNDFYKFHGLNTVKLYVDHIRFENSIGVEIEKLRQAAVNAYCKKKFREI